MVHLVLYSPNGNLGARAYPYTGYFGLTPLRVEGFIYTKLSADNKPLPASSITVSIQCYESRIGRVGVTTTNIIADYSQTLWQKPEGQDYAEIGNLDLAFRISIPTDGPGASTATFPEYRVAWKVEATLNHIPIAGVGSRQIKHFDLPIVRYNIPPALSPPLPPLSLRDLNLETNKRRAPIIRYKINTPTNPIGPFDIVSVPIYLAPVDPSVSIRSASLIVERRIHIKTPPSPPSHDDTTSPEPASSSSSSSPPASQRPASASAVSSTTTLIANDPRPYTANAVPSSSRTTTTLEVPPAKAFSTSVAGVESSGRFIQDADGKWTKNLTFCWPGAKTRSRWAIGETCSTELVTIKFVALIKIVVSSPSGTESIDLAEQDLLVTATSETEREFALVKYNQENSSSGSSSRIKSKSKSPRRASAHPSEVDHLGHVAPMGLGLPGGSAPFTSEKPRDSSRGSKSQRASTYPSEVDHLERASAPTGLPGTVPFASERPGESSRRPKSARRPHTSTGSSKRVGDFPMAPPVDEPMPDVRPDTGNSETGESSKATATSGFRWPLSSTSRSNSSQGFLESSSSRKKTPTTPYPTLENTQPHTEPIADHIRAWEDELARIEVNSRRTSAMLPNLAGKRKRGGDHPQPPPPPPASSRVGFGSRLARAVGVSVN